MKIFAHRGYSRNYPENTMVAFKAAEQVGADGIELDVHLTKDHQIVVIHDETINRTSNGSGKIKDMTVKELKSFTYDYRFTGFNTTISTLDEVFEWLKENQLMCNVELKNNLYEYKGLEKKVVELIKDYSFDRRIVLSSFNHHSLLKCKELNNSIECAALYSDKLVHPERYIESIKVEGIHPPVHYVTDELLVDCKKMNVPIRPYTVNNMETIERLAQLGCTAVFTDVPEEARKKMKN
ncbi:hypothetical protein Q73_09000 [Bacillus coahuilensis m2-6]|uniref:glycerophosphodiester phosphodiesterase n=1 Tax=Bacillus coahuilensis TaxID=408580 RepID=UPI000185108B|nr:glycerophosphodiester phosphodiesterase [Bacillus coahuilensis]KUP07350.1 hypothetical protein Q73_09000 [Bacillus coahuilensis m2-6]